MNTWVAPGVRCICVNDDWTEFTARGQVFPVRQPMIDEVLTIRDVQPGLSGGNGEPMHGYLGFWEIDIVQESGAVFASIHWIVTHFRPVQEPNTDISELSALLEPGPGELQRECVGWTSRSTAACSPSQSVAGLAGLAGCCHSG